AAHAGGRAGVDGVRRAVFFHLAAAASRRSSGPSCASGDHPCRPAPVRIPRKIPFTCSYLPGKANVHVISGAYAIVLLALAEMGVQFELRALEDTQRYATMLGVLGIAAVWAWRRTAARAALPDASLQFEEIPQEDIFALELHRDGKLR